MRFTENGFFRLVCVLLYPQGDDGSMRQNRTFGVHFVIIYSFFVKVDFFYAIMHNSFFALTASVVNRVRRGQYQIPHDAKGVSLLLNRVYEQRKGLRCMLGPGMQQNDGAVL